MKDLQSMEMFKSEIQSGTTVIMFSADWCPDCRVIEPFLPEVEAKFSQIDFIYANRDQFIDLCAELNVFGIPSFIAYHHGQEVHRLVSKDRKTQEEIENFLTDALSKC
ncbi:thiol reductase thioredoxin [Alkalihalophilus pseudofirmus]|uniref:thioredoxin family protein n=1 Tax=Alkalihalobacterium alkalinitrilicum TaxID=427920 RepID=UPI00094D9107|nr:thioredoxin family protein [Alkalihalobacterium alkalinitrilicum]OLO40208.1 thiol reductase thioredoxin [Alkalihalophilus pseudofirmus]